MGLGLERVCTLWVSLIYAMDDDLEVDQLVEILGIFQGGLLLCWCCGIDLFLSNSIFGDLMLFIKIS